jgi:hypothetical protein
MYTYRSCHVLILVFNIYKYLCIVNRGQGHPMGNSTPYFGPCVKLDFELEMVR